MISKSLFIASLILLLAGCQTLGTRAGNGDAVVQHASSTLSENQLLDVWIELFESGPIPTDGKASAGITPEIRKAEGRFIPVHLKNTLQSSGYWGAVRVVPQNTQGGELLVRGKILASDGGKLELQIQAYDSRGESWLNQTYSAEIDAEAGAYDNLSIGKYDAFQALYNTIANDLAQTRNGLSDPELAAIRRVAELRFASNLAPQVFEERLTAEGGKYASKGQPVTDDPMLRRIRAIRERDFMLIDTLNDHYNLFYRDMWEPYGNWRRFRAEEAARLKQIEREALTRKLIGIGAVLGAIALSTQGNRGINTSLTRSMLLLGGAYVAKTGFDKDSEKQIHVDAIEELGLSFESEIAPIVVEVDGNTHQLTGSAEAQYARWRGLLQRIYASENSL